MDDSRECMGNPPTLRLDDGLMTPRLSIKQVARYGIVLRDLNFGTTSAKETGNEILKFE
jgi:hypothetical protein